MRRRPVEPKRAVSFAALYNNLNRWEFMKRFTYIAIRIVPVLILAALVAIPIAHAAWTEDEFEHRPLFAYPLPHGNRMGRSREQSVHCQQSAGRTRAGLCGV